MKLPVDAEILTGEGNRFSTAVGSTYPSLRVRFVDAAGEPIDYQGYARILFEFKDKEWPVELTDDNVVEYEWKFDDLNEPGRYQARFRIEYTDGKQLRVPTESPIDILVQS